MINTVSTWVCKCGRRVKVVGQTPKDHSTATQIAICPNCGDEQTVYGETIISITLEDETHQTAT